MSSTVVTISNVLGWGGFFLYVVYHMPRSRDIIHLPETIRRSLEQMSVYFADITTSSILMPKLRF
jgi:hypothetical protein